MTVDLDAVRAAWNRLPETQQELAKRILDSGAAWSIKDVVQAAIYQAPGVAKTRLLHLERIGLLVEADRFPVKWRANGDERIQRIIRGSDPLIPPKF